MTRLPTLLTARPDGDLLARFAADRDEIAFAELVRRHGPAVWGVCRRGLPDAADAEDAFQAVFLVLVRRADRLAECHTVGPWLHRVATITARDLRRKNARRLARVRPLPADVPVHPPVPVPDLDAALLSLPAKYRTAVVLCHLEGLTQREAAARLGCREKTLSSHVSRGLAKLRAKLARDPLPLTVTTLPAGLATATARAAVAFAAASAAPSAGVAALTEGVLRMFWVKRAVTAAGCVLVAVAAVGVGSRLATADDPPPDPVAAAKDRQERLRKELGPKVADLQRQLKEADDAVARAEQAARLKAVPPGKPPAGPAIVVTVASAAQAEWGGWYTLAEYGAGGKPVATYATSDGASLRTYLARAAADPAGPRALVLAVNGPYTSFEKVEEAARACGAFGHEPVRLRLIDGAPVRADYARRVATADPAVAEFEVDRNLLGEFIAPTREYQWAERVKAREKAAGKATGTATGPRLTVGESKSVGEIVGRVIGIQQSTPGVADAKPDPQNPERVLVEARKPGVTVLAVRTDRGDTVLVTVQVR